MGVNKWDFLSLTMGIVIASKHVAVVVLVLVIAAAILAVIADVETVSSAEDSTRDAVATKNVTMISSVVLAISSIGNRETNDSK